MNRPANSRISFMINTAMHENLQRKLIDYIFIFRLIGALLTLVFMTHLFFKRYLPVEAGPPLASLSVYMIQFPVFWAIRQRRPEWLVPFNLFGFCLDIATMTLVLHYFGGIYCMVWWVEYPFSIAFSSIFLSRPGRLVYALYVLAGYSLLCYLEHFGIIARVDLFLIPFNSQLDMFCWVSSTCVILMTALASSVFVDIITDLQHFAQLGRISAEIAHELRTPLQVIEGVTERPGYPEAGRKEIKVQVEQISRVIKEVLALGRQEIQERSVVRLEAIVAHTVNLVHQVADPAKTIHLKKEFCDENILVNVDIDQIIKVFSNILRNAIDAIDREGEVRVCLSSEGAAWARVSVHDTGVGMDKKEVKQIFEPYYTTKPGTRGVGLGLAVARKFIQANSGKIEVTSQRGEGSTFTIRLPVHFREGESKKEQQKLLMLSGYSLNISVPTLED